MQLHSEEFVDDLTGRPAFEALAEIAAALQRGRSFVVATHDQPDGDGLGSGAALVLGLRALGKTAALVLSREMPTRYRTLVPADVVEVAGEGGERLSPAGWDTCVVLDTNDPERLEGLRDALLSSGRRRICVDHHIGERRPSFDHQLLVSRAPATASLVLSLLDALGVSLDATISRCLWLALSTDTGWFRFANTTPRALRDAARLVEAGAVPEALRDEIYGSHRIARMRLVGEVLRGLRSAVDGKLVWGFVSRDLLAKTGVALAEIDGVIDHVRDVESARVAALITEVGEASYKVSLRAKGSCVVEPLARRHGGGGHAKAAGFRFQGRLEDLETELRRSVEEITAGTA